MQPQSSCSRQRPILTGQKSLQQLASLLRILSQESNAGKDTDKDSQLENFVDPVQNNALSSPFGCPVAPNWEGAPQPVVDLRVSVAS